jgi:hypothetical protein
MSKLESRNMRCACIGQAMGVLLLLASMVIADDSAADLSSFDSEVLPGEAATWRSMVRDDLKRRLTEVNRDSRVASLKLKTKDEWEAFLQPKLEALRTSLGDWPKPPDKPNTRVTASVDGEGYRVENIVFESRPGLWVTANLYSPRPLKASMPGIIISHSHHRPKE